tara:strand:+ start:36 stop:233 length:198 start_codon:yes stop_codon:yes gene_type:complete
MKNKTNEQVIGSLSLVSHQIEMGYLGVGSPDKQPCMDVINEAIRRITYMHIKGIENEDITERLGY